MRKNSSGFRSWSRECSEGTLEREGRRHIVGTIRRPAGLVLGAESGETRQGQLIICLDFNLNLKRTIAYSRK